MADIKQFTQRVKFVRKNDIKAIPKMCFGFLLSIPYRILHRNIWLVCERENEARDNGYWFFKYLCENKPHIEAVYAINKNGIDYEKVKVFGNIVQFGSLMHWIMYFSADKNISSQKEGKPNAALCYILEVYLGMRKNRIYLKHGIIKDYQRWIFYDVSKLNMMCCAAEREQKYIQENFGYPKQNVKLVGLCRFDNLLTEHNVKRQILIMPTMREWLKTISSDTLKYEASSDFVQSEYYLTWSSLIKSNRLSCFLEENDIDILFYPHPAMQKYIDNFMVDNKHIIVASDGEYDLQQLLIESAVLITDYSSVFFDFAYMRKPLIYYQFDYEKYRKGQYQEGYFSYSQDGFGAQVFSEEELLSELSLIIKNDLAIEKKYEERINSFFAFYDTNNCKRTFDAIVNLDIDRKKQ